MCLSIRYNYVKVASASFNVQPTFASKIISDDSSATSFNYTVDDWRREITIGPWGGLSVVDRCSVTNNVNESVNNVQFILPANATSISVQDAFGSMSKTSLSIVDNVTYVWVRVFLRGTLGWQEKVRLLISYHLPSSVYIQQRGWQDYTLTISLGKPDDWFVEQLTVAVFLPEGAEYQEASTTSIVQKSGFSTTVEFKENNVTQINEPTITLKYQYFILWIVFRPALWTGTAVAIFVVILFARRTSKPLAEVVTAAPFSPDLLRGFLNRCDERRRLLLELETMEGQVEKGKISRRNYRMRKNSIDDHLSRLQRDLSELRKKIAAASGQYLERMKQLETAEAEIETLKKDIMVADARFLRREITAEAHRKMLDEYNRMKERAENTIDETLLRLREDIR